MGLPGLLKLMNHDNAAAFSIGGESVKDQASSASQGSAVKLTSLSGSIFNHKDDKKGQQDTYNNFFEERLGKHTRFPDTSNTRYQSHCEAATTLLLYRDLFLEFMELVRSKKESQTFNHMESNVYQGLQDLSTLEELCVLSLFSLAVSHPYMRRIRGENHQNTNALDLGPLHHEILAFMHQVIEDPSLILGEQATYQTATFDKKPFNHPEIFVLIKSSQTSYLHLEGLLVDFFTGAAETFSCFSAEFEVGGVIDLLTPQMCWLHG